MNPRTSSTSPRREILAVMERIYDYRMTTTSGGNLSLRDEEGNVWITPTRVDKGSLRREDIVRVRKDGTVEGLHPPSSELPLHLAIYRARPEIRGVVHAHPVALVAFSVVHEVPNTRLFHKARTVCGEVGFAPYELPGSEALARNVENTFRQGCACAILENHGVVTGGGSIQEAFHRFETLEFTGKTIIKARQIGNIRYLNDEEIELAGRRPGKLAECQGETPSVVEQELRERLAEFVRRAYRQRLFISTQGSFSARLDESRLLITPYQVDRGRLNPQDLVLVREGKAEAGKRPSLAAANHEAIYRRHSGIRAVINAYPVNATAFSVTGVPLNTCTIPESYVVVRQIRQLSYGVQFQNSEELARQVSPRQPAALLENDGVLVTGADILEAYDRLEVLESTAEALINCRALGTLAPMSDEVTRQLDETFLKM
jgi:L-fuculose-phosphate aldolase